MRGPRDSRRGIDLPRERESWTTSMMNAIDDIGWDLNRDSEEYFDAMSDVFRETPPNDNFDDPTGASINYQSGQDQPYYLAAATNAVFYGNRDGVFVRVSIPGLENDQFTYIRNIEVQDSERPEVAHPAFIRTQQEPRVLNAADRSRNSRFPGNEGYEERLARTRSENVLPDGTIMSVRQRRTRNGQRARARRLEAHRRQLLASEREQLIANIRAHEVTEEQAQATQEQEEVCPICFRGFSEGNTYSTLLCGHSFHTECVQRWLREGRDGGTDSCPMCRQDVFDQDTTTPVTQALVEALRQPRPAQASTDS